MTQTASDLAAHETFGEIFSRAHALYRGGKVVPVRGHMGIVRGFVNVSTPKGVRRDVFYFTQPRGVGCCLLAAAMIGLEVPTPVGIDQTTLAPIIPLPLSWLLYRTAAENFRMIESGMLPVIIQGDDEARKAVRDLENEHIPSAVLARKLQPYVVQVPPRSRALLLDAGHAAFMAPKLRGEQFAVLALNSDLYDSRVGLIWENAEYLSSEQWMF